ncbi:MAG: ATP-binding protein [Verrucomicrobiia bacterium]|jgi:AAA+ ATPase superfamily predicted ATPase
MATVMVANPFKPGAGHMPPYLAGRDKELKQFSTLLGQKTILTNVILTGLRGVGKTVLLEKFKPLALEKKWLWVGTDLSESTSINEETVAKRLLTDLSVVTSRINISENTHPVGFSEKGNTKEKTLTYKALYELYETSPGLVADKIKSVLYFVWLCTKELGINGIAFAYDEAQTMSDHADKDQYPLSLLLDVFQSIQKRDIPFMLVLVGLPTLFPRLVEARTFAERMFTIIMLDRLEETPSREAILKPIEDEKCPVRFNEKSINLIVTTSGGYPYFIQYICKEIFDIFLQKTAKGDDLSVPLTEIIRKMDSDFFAGRWARATDRQRDLLKVVASLPNCDEEFSVQEIVAASKKVPPPFSPSHTNQMLASLSDAGLVYKNRHGRYALAVPLLGQFIRRQEKERQQFPWQPRLL